MASVSSRVLRLKRELGTRAASHETESERRYREWEERRPELHRQWYEGLDDRERQHHMMCKVNHLALPEDPTRRVYLGQVRCAHQLLDLLGGPRGDDVAEAAWWIVDTLRRRGDLAADAGNEACIEALLAFLGTLNDNPAYRPRSLMTPHEIRVMYSRDDEHRRRRIADAIDAGEYPQGRPLPPCPECKQGD